MGSERNLNSQLRVTGGNRQGLKGLSLVRLADTAMDQLHEHGEAAQLVGRPTEASIGGLMKARGAHSLQRAPFRGARKADRGAVTGTAEEEW